ncbi:MAG: rRNA maturation RNase YbeY, partial [Bacteroidota bacterium]
MIHYYNEDSEFVPSKKTYLTDWIKSVIADEQRKVGEINFIFCSDAHLITINRQYLEHDDYTDIITFDYCENKKVIGDIFISIDRITENA